MCMIKAVWQLLVTSPFLFLPPSCQNFPLSTHHTSSSPIASGTHLCGASVSCVQWVSRLCFNKKTPFRIEMSSSASPEAACQLDSRYWKITTSDGNVEEVQGPGVVGTVPHLYVDSFTVMEMSQYCVCMFVQESFLWWLLERSMSTPAALPSPPPQSTWRVTTPSTDWVMPILAARWLLHSCRSTPDSILHTVCLFSQQRGCFPSGHPSLPHGLPPLQRAGRQNGKVPSSVATCYSLCSLSSCVVKWTNSLHPVKNYTVIASDVSVMFSSIWVSFLLHPIVWNLINCNFFYAWSELFCLQCKHFDNRKYIEYD